MEIRELGLFPLDLVLMPGERIPLHIFEPRYRELYADCVLQEQPFVLVRAEEGTAAGVGCAARFEDLLQRTQDGRLHVIVLGVEPVEILEETHGAHYFTARCRTLTDEPGDASPELVAEATERFARLATALGAAPRTPPAAEGVPLSYAIAGAVAMPAPIKQTLLETRDEPRRLESVNRYLDVAIRAAGRVEMAAERAKSNGKVSHS